MPKRPDQEHPLANIFINVLIPVLSLSFLSKDGDRPWHLGPGIAMAVALTLPVGYGIWFFAKTRKMNPFSLLGLGSVLLTGGLTLYLWNKDGTVKPHADVLFGLKEASIPLVLGLAILGSLGISVALLGRSNSTATELIDSLQLQYNKARQASITRELLEIVSGAEALSAAR